MRDDAEDAADDAEIATRTVPTALPPRAGRRVLHRLLDRDAMRHQVDIDQQVLESFEVSRQCFQSAVACSTSGGRISRPMTIAR